MTIKIKTFTYERGANLGNFETVKFTVGTELAEGDSVKDAYLKLKDVVDKAISLELKDNEKILRDDRGARRL